VYCRRGRTDRRDKFAHCDACGGDRRCGKVRDPERRAKRKVTVERDSLYPFIFSAE
jgi:hypothetical protein